MNIANRILLILGAWSIPLNVATVALGDDIQWNNASGGSFQTGGNWSGSNAPGSTDTAIFDLATAGYTVTFTAGPTTELLFVLTDTVTFDLDGFTYMVTDPGFPAGSGVRLGELSAQDARLTITDGTLAAQGLTVGVSGQGRLDINTSGLLTTAVPSHIASLTGSIGDVFVSGAGSSWTMADHLIIGQSGIGTLTVESGGAVSTTWCSLGNNSDGEGTILVTGPSSFSFDEFLSVGAVGAGTLTVSAGGQLTATSGSGNLAIGSSGIGHATFTGLGSLVDVTGHSILVGNMNQGEVTVSAGTHLITGFIPGAGGVGGLVGYDPGGDGEVIVTGSGSQWIANQQVHVGRDGALGVVRVEAGGYLETHKDISPTDSSGIIGIDSATNPPGSGTVIVQDSGSSWVNDGMVNVGWNDPGDLQVLLGGDVTSVDGVIGRLADSDGTVTIDGVGSTWTLSDSLYIGGTGAGAGGIGELILTDSGAVSVQNLLKIWPQGTLTVNGGSVTVVAGTIQSDGTVRGGGTITENVTNANGTVAPGTSAGILTIDGDYTQGSAGTLAIEIGGTSPGTQYDRLVVTGAASLDGGLAISLINAFSPSAGTTFQVLSYASHSGTFASVTWPGVAFATRYESNGVFVDVLASAPATAPSPHDIAKNRYISFAPNNGAGSVAFKVTMTASAFTGPTGDLGWVGAPDANGVSRIVAAPVTRVWPELTIHIGDCGIAPAATYEVRATGDGGGSFTQPLVVTTIVDPPGSGTWGDVNPPLGTSNRPDFLDINAVVNVFLGVPTALHFTRADLDPQVPNGVVNFTDVLHAFRAFVRLAYPFTASCSSCCASNLECDNIIFCDGGELCASCLCVPGPAPCASGCNEGNDTCGVTASNRPRLSLVPTGATGAFGISNDEITLTGAGQRVYLELQVSNWDSDHSAPPRLGAYQATVDSASFTGANASPPNPGVNCAPSWVSCPSVDATGHTFCRSTFGVPNGPSCKAAADLSGCPYTNCCDPAFIDTTRSDWAYSTGFGARAVRITNPDYAWGANYPGGSPGPTDSGAVSYAGTLALDVPIGAMGTYTISLKSGSLDTFLDDETGIELGGLLLGAARITIVPPPTIHVNAAAIGQNDGTSWVNAYRSLRDALAAANAGSEIWVAKGTYMPDGGYIPPGGAHVPGTGLRTATFQLKNGVEIYGGFRGDEPGREQRDLEHNETILSADLNDDDTDVPCAVNSPDCDSFGELCVDGFCIISQSTSENAFHVVTGTGPDGCILDGFRVSDGNSNGSNPDDIGGGLLGAHAGDGGGVKRVTVRNCMFSRNASSGSGGAIYMTNNPANEMTLHDCVFRNNAAGVSGGAIVYGNGSADITNCAFVSNSSPFAGGVRLTSTGTISVSNSTFTGNKAIGGVGGLELSDSDAAVANCLFSQNTGAVGAIGVVGLPTTGPSLTNCTVINNTATGNGGGVFVNTGSLDTTLANCVLWGNSDSGGNDETAQLHLVGGSGVIIDYSIVQQWTGGGTTSGSDPLLNAAGALQAGSPAIDAGDTAVLPPDSFDLDGDGNTTERISQDLGGNPRILDDPATDPGTGVDMGAYEYFSDCDGGGVPDACDLDCGTPDGPCDIPGCGDSLDCNANGVPDACDIADCSGDPLCDDCNLNGKPDGCDVSSSTGCPGGTCTSACSSDANQDCVPDDCAVTTGAGGTPFWDDGTNWALSGSFPDDTAGVADQNVTLEDSLILNISVEIDSLEIAGGVTLDVTGGDLLIEEDAPQTAGITPPPKLRLSLDGAIAMANGYDVTVGDSVAVNSGGLYHSSSATDSALLAVDIAVYAGGEISLEHDMTMTSSGTVSLDGKNADPVCLPSAVAGSVAGITPPPKLRLADDGIAYAAGSVSLVGAVDVIVASTQPMLLGGDFDNRATAPHCFNWSMGRLVLNGAAPQVFEVAGLNLGQTTAGFLTDADTLYDSNQHTNFSMGTVEVASTANVTFANRFANTSGVGCGEALYVHNLIFHSGATVTFDNCKVFYDTLTDDGVTPALIGCGDLLPTTPPNTVVWDPTLNPIPWPNTNPLATTRSLRFSVVGPASTKQEAIKITMIDLQHPIPANLPQNPPQNFSGYESATCAPFKCVGGARNGLTCTVPGDCPDGGMCTSTVESNGCARWVGRPGTFLESQDSGPSGGTYRASRLQCTPFYWDWKPEGLIAVVGAEITPSSEYSVQVYGASCTGTEGSCTNVSPAVTMFTRRAGDVGPNFNPPATTTQPDAIDVVALVNKFKGLAGAPVKAIAQIQPNLTELNADLSALDITAAVDGVKQVAYSFSGPCACPSTVPCGITACANATVCVNTYGVGSTCVKTCVGGSNAGDPCINTTDPHNHCPGGGVCGAGGATPGFCRDRCGRCTP